MAEGGLLESLLGGGEPEEPDEELAGATLDPAAAAAAIHAARADPALAAEAALYFKAQRHYVGIQTEHLHEQRTLQLAHLRLRRLSDQLKITSQALVVFVVLMVGGSLAVMVYDAASSHSMVVEQFVSPPNLSGRGLTGEVVASGVLDALQTLSDATRTNGQGLAAQSAWSSDVKIELAETGVSIGEVARLLHSRLGHDTHVSGDLLQTESGGLALTVRGDRTPPRTFRGPDLDVLTTQAAEYIYGRDNPRNYAAYLLDARRFTDEVAFMPGAYARAPEAERADYAVIWSMGFQGLADNASAAEKYRLALDLEPHDWLAWDGLVGQLSALNEPDEAFQQAQALDQAIAAAPADKRPPPEDISADASLRSDYPMMLKARLSEMKRANGVGSGLSPSAPWVAADYGYLYDRRNERKYLALSNPDDPVTRVMAGFLAAGEAMQDRGDYAAAVPLLEKVQAMMHASPFLQAQFGDSCELEVAYARAGRAADAAAERLREPPIQDCLLDHAEALDAEGDTVAAQAILSNEIKAHPYQSDPHERRGELELRRGNLAAAAADFAAVQTLSPHWPDHLKYWGDVLVRQGQSDAALAKYDLALRDAPAWVALQQARAAAQAGRSRGAAVPDRAH